MAGPGSFPPEVVVAVKSLACELPSRLGVPLSRLHVPDIATRGRSTRGIVAEISGDHHLALAVRGRHQALAAPLLDLPARSRLRDQSGARARPLREAVAGKAARQARLRHLLRREDLHPGPRPLPREPPAGGHSGRHASSTSTTGEVPFSTSPPGTSIGPRCSGVASPPPVSSLSAVSSSR